MTSRARRERPSGIDITRTSCWRCCLAAEPSNNIASNFHLVCYESATLQGCGPVSALTRASTPGTLPRTPRRCMARSSSLRARGSEPAPRRACDVIPPIDDDGARRRVNRDSGENDHAKCRRRCMPWRPVSGGSTRQRRRSFADLREGGGRLGNPPDRPRSECPRCRRSDPATSGTAARLGTLDHLRHTDSIPVPQAPAELLAERDYVLLPQSGGAPDTVAHCIFRVHRRQSRRTR